MPAPAATFRPPPGFAGAYQKIGVETGVLGASPHRLVTMLFDGFKEAVAQAKSAMARRDIAAKGTAINRAARIVNEGLLASLDKNGGGKIAADLSALYGYVAVRLTYSNLHNDPRALDECVSLIEPVASAWAAIGPSMEPS